MLETYPIMTPLRFCPVCGEPLESSVIDSSTERGCSSGTCKYHEPGIAGSYVSLISRMLTHYAQAGSIMVATVRGQEIPTHIAMRPDALLPLLVDRAYNTHTAAGLNVYPGLEFPLRAISDKNGLLQYRTTYQSGFALANIHVASLVLTDTFEELLTLSHKNSDSKYQDFVNFDILLDRQELHPLRAPSEGCMPITFDAPTIEAIARYLQSNPVGFGSDEPSSLERGVKQ